MRVILPAECLKLAKRFNIDLRLSSSKTGCWSWSFKTNEEFQEILKEDCDPESCTVDGLPFYLDPDNSGFMRLCVLIDNDIKPADEELRLLWIERTAAIP